VVLVNEHLTTGVELPRRSGPAEISRLGVGWGGPWGRLAQGFEGGERAIDAAPELTAADPIPPVVPVVLGEHHQDRERLDEFVALVHRQLAEELQLGVHHTVQEVGFISYGAMPPAPQAALPRHYVHHL
jgi:hypothetical protein